MNPAIDANTSVEQVIAEEKMLCRRPTHEPGGGGINVSRAIRKLGGESIALYTSGGANGRLLQELLDREGLNQYPIPIKDMTRENFIVFEEVSQRQFRFGVTGPTLSEEEWQDCLSTLKNIRPKPEYIVASGSLPPGVPDDFYARVVRIAKELGARIIVDTTGEPLHLAAREGVFLIKPNMRELQDLFKKEMMEESQIQELAADFIKKGRCQVVVVSLGAAGALMVTAEGTKHLRTPTVPIKSKVGAGDSMVGGIVLSLARGWSMTDAVRYGVAAGAAAVMTPGTELCRKEDTDRLYQII